MPCIMQSYSCNPLVQRKITISDHDQENVPCSHGKGGQDTLCEQAASYITLAALGDLRPFI